MLLLKRFFLSCFFSLFLSQTEFSEKKFEFGKQLFFSNCNVCHYGGNNIIIPEKNLKKETLERNGMNTFEAITYQITNWKSANWI